MQVIYDLRETAVGVSTGVPFLELLTVAMPLPAVFLRAKNAISLTLGRRRFVREELYVIYGE